MKKIKKFHDLFEFKDNTFSDQELLEMANITDESTGIDDVVLWVGPPPPSHGHRIKVSNVANTFKSDCFVMTIPDFKIIGDVNKSFITLEKIEKIKKFVLKNIDIILKYSNYEISTKDFLNNLIKI